MENAAGSVNIGIIKLSKERTMGVVSDIHPSLLLYNFRGQRNSFVISQGHEGKFTAENFAII